MKKLTVTERLMARAVALEEANQEKLQDLTGYSRMQVSRIMHKPAFADEVDRLIERVEEHEVARKREAFKTVYDNIENIVEELCKIATDEKVAAGIRANACEKVMSYVFRKKDVGREDEDKGKYIAVQPNPRDSVKDDPDVNPNVVQFKEVVGNE